MRCSQVHQMTTGNLNPTKLKTSNCSTDLPYSSDNDFVELLWENGQVVMQSHSGRTRKSTLSPSPIQERDGNDAAFVKAGKYAVPEYNASGTSTSGPSGRVYTAHNDDLVPCWLNRPVEDSLPGDYCPEFSTDLSYANPKPLSEQHCSVPVQRNGRFSQPLRDPKVVSAHEDANLEHENVPKAGGRGSDRVKFRSSQLFQSSQLCPASDPKSGVSTFLPSIMQQSHYKSSSASRVAATGLLNSMQLKNDPLPTRPLQPCNKGLMNFSHFSSPASLFKANLQNSRFPGAGASGTSKFRGSDKAPFNSSNPIEPSVVKSTSSLRSNSEELISARAKVDPKPPNTTPQEVGTTKESEAVRREDALRNRRSPDHHFQSSSFAASFALGHPKDEKAFVTSVASSSACSGYSTEGVSHDAKHGLKRKGQVAEESECQSDDAEDESVDVKRPTKSLKRSRSAEVHNLSERRRRDRINEKMRALQELIPNCNKTDKASMLDEAIEYLKTLQLQVQIMSMGTGLCMPPMMFPAGIQKIRPSPIPHFPPMGIGMSMGFGMGMNDISRSSGYPLISVPPMQGLQFPCTSVSGFTGFHGLPGTSTQMFGFPGQALPSSLPRTPFIPLSGFSTALLSVPDLSVAAAPMPVPNSSLPSSPKDQIQNASLRKDA